ncbi:MAG: aspartate--tRNA ligase, partial [Bacilli bacterium]|nr:aspartate--tRNA ligase [Bacilli bacterium]
MYRNHVNGTLRLSDVGSKVTLTGWVATRRNLGSLLFLDLRDSTGIVQCVSLTPDELPDVRNEYVVQVVGEVRAKEVPNKNLPTGEVEVLIERLTVLSKAETTPFIIADKTDALEDTRLQYRYLDLRRPCLQNNLRIRAKIVHAAHEYFQSHGFLEIETPILNLSSPEGAKEYLVPSRIRHGSFYALPQSPQLWKQLLMIGGLERYYQIARCFRDEDLRADRQPEFTQIDLETSFLDMDEILTLMEGFLQKAFKEGTGVDIQLPLRRIPYWEAMDRFGSDKPDTRFGLELQDLGDILKRSSFEGFGANDYVKGIVVPGVAKETSRKNLDELSLEARKFGLKGVFALKSLNGTLEGSFAKFLTPELTQALIERLSLQEGDLLLFASHAGRRNIDTGLGALRSLYARKLNLIPPGTYDLFWVVDFPMFTPVEGEDRYVAEHHPFTRPRDEDLPLLDSKPEEVLAYAYDIVINGYEAGGGTLRIFDHDTQWKIF